MSDWDKPLERMLAAIEDSNESIRCGIAIERKRVRDVLLHMRDHESDRGCGVFITDIAARLGIDLSQSASKGESNGE